MAWDFPASPTEGQVFTPAGGPTYTYRAPAWRSGVIGIPDAAQDNGTYARRNGLWVDVGYRTLARVKPAVILSVPVVIAVPSDVSTLRITGTIVSTAGGYCLMQASSNGGSTWEGAAMYALAQLYYAGAAGGQVVSTDYIFLSGSSSSAGIYRNTVSCLYTPADGANRGEAISHVGNWSGSAQVLVNYTITGTAAKTNAVRILMGAGNIGVGTDILVEAL